MSSIKRLLGKGPRIRSQVGSFNEKLFSVCFLSFTLVFFLWIGAPAVKAALQDETADNLPVDSDDSYRFAAADIDGQNGVDIVVANRGQSRILLNDGSGKFTDATDGRLPLQLSTTLAVALADIDGINGPDLILGNTSENRVLINNGAGVFTDETAGRLPQLSPQVTTDVDLRDVNGDGYPDLLFTNRDSQNRLLINNGDGFFDDETDTRLPLDNDRSHSGRFFDADGDGAPEIFFANRYGQNRLLQNNGLGEFDDITDPALPIADDDSLEVAFFDYDRDGDPDIAVASGSEGIILLDNNGGVFTDVTASQVPALDDYVMRVAVGDIDFDGTLDLLCGNAGQDRILLYDPDADTDGNFTDGTAGQLPADTRSFDVILLDADDDFDLDVAVAVPQGQNRYYENAIAFPRIRVTVSPDYIEKNDTVTIAAEAFDEDGVTSISVEVVQPDSSIAAPSGPVDGPWTFVPSQEGPHVVRVTATDTLSNDGVMEASFGALANDVTDPDVSLSISQASVTQGEIVDFQVTATDDRAVVSRSLTVGGINLPLDTTGHASFAPLATGTLAVVAQASDAAGNTGTASTTLEVLPDTESPLVSLSATPDPIDITNPITIDANASDNITVSSFIVTVNGPQPGGPTDEPIALDAAGQATYTPFIPGTYTFSATASDPAGNETQATTTVEALGIPDAENPVVTLTVVPGTTIPGGTVTLTVNATDNIFVVSRTLTINGTPVALDGNNQAQFTAPVIGDYTAVATAVDPTGNVGSDTVVFTAVDPATDTDPPVVAITSPADDAEITDSTDIIGTVTDLTLVGYALEYAPVGTSDFTTFTTGSQPIQNDVLGTLDPTMLENGVYTIRLTAEDINGLISVTDVVVNVTGDLKLGQFSVSFLDKALNIGRLPLDVTRAYDSRKRGEKGDFGYGWSIRLTEAELMENRSPGEHWRQDVSGGFFNTYTLVGTRPHTVTIRFSEEDEVRFSARPNPYQSQIVPIQYIDSMEYLPIGDAEGSLQDNDLPAFYNNGEILDFDFEIYNPSGFTYQADDGYSYVFSETNPSSLRHTLRRITDPNGTSVDLTSDGFTRSDGLSLSFIRDGEGRITKLTDPNGNEVLYEYDANGDLAAVTDPEGNITRFVYTSGHYMTEIQDSSGTPIQKQEYDDDGRLIAVTDGDGNRIEMEYDLDANTQIIRDRRGNPKIYEYDSKGNITRETNFPEVDGVVQPVETTRVFDADSQLSSETNGLGVQTIFTYTPSGERESMKRDVGGLELTETLTYDAGGRVLTDTDPRGNTVTNTYDGNGNRLSTEDRAGNTNTYEYNSRGLVEKETDPLGNYTLFGYDAKGNKTSEERYDMDDNQLRRLEFTHDANGNKLTEIVLVTINSVLTPLTTTFEYDGNDQIVKEIDPAGRTRFTEYDELRRKSAEIDAFDKRTEYSYNSLDEITRIDYPDGTATIYTFDKDGNRITETNRDVQTTTFDYDALDQITRIEHPDATERQKRYDKAGNVIGEYDEVGNRTDHQYDAVGRRTRTLQPEVYDAAADANLRPETRYEYDENGNQTALVDANNHRTEYTYDKENRLTETLFPDSSITSVFIDPAGNEVSKTDAAGNKTLYEYDALKRLIMVSLPKPTASDPRPETDYAYDEGGRMISQLDADSHETQFEYDLVGNLTGRILPEGQGEEFTYDLENRKATHKDFNGKTTTYAYDVVGRRTSITYHDSSTVVTTYTGEGQPLSVTDSRGATAYSYDTRGRLLSRTGPDSVVMSYTYTATNKQASVSSPAGKTDYAYDALNRLATVIDPGGDMTSYAYDAVGNLARVTYENGTVAEYTYNSRNQLTDLVNKRSDDTVISAYAYDLDPNGLRTRVTEHDGSVVDFTYDGNYRLVQEVRTGANPYNHQFTYDAVGNRTGTDYDGSSTTYIYDMNDRLNSAGSKVYGYDANGNLTSLTDGSDVSTYDYDPENRLVRTENPLGDVTRYVYDAQGHRVQQLDGIGTVIKDYIVDTRSNSGVAQVLEERDSSGDLIVQYSHGHDLISQSRSGSVSYYHYDGIGSTRALTDDLEATTDTYLYDGYGRELASSGTSVNQYRFTGEQFDPNIGFYFLRARYYDQNTGRFVSMDPMAGDPLSPISLHRYLYANNNPVNFTDPTGKFSLVSISISMSINTSIRSIYTQNLVKFFLKAAKIAYCQLEPAYQMQALALDMIARDLPGGFKLLQQARENIAGAFRAIGKEIGQTYKNIAKDIIKVKLEVGTDLDELYDTLTANSAMPNSSDIQKLFGFKETLKTWLDRYGHAMDVVDALNSNDACGLFCALDAEADFLTGLIPSF